MANQLRYENDDGQDIFTNRSTMMANFEEWIKMATDNKINSSNSWNFALIDYFYDLNVLRDSENNINFQKASATLDGCVKIYSSRVDSVSNETGKLLSGLAQRKEVKKKGNGDGGDDDGEEAEEDEEGGVRIDPETGRPTGVETEVVKSRVHNRVLETTLVEFDTIKLKELDQELNIDPLFKKALVDFDEGGSKSLLLNTLGIDDTLRIVFDAAIKDDKSKKVADVEDEEDNDDDDVLMDPIEDSSIAHSGIADEQDSAIGNATKDSAFGNDTKDTTFVVEDEVLALGMDFIKFDKLSISEIAPSIGQLRSVVEDINKAKAFVENVNKKDNYLTEQEINDTAPDNYDMPDDQMDMFDGDAGDFNDDAEDAGDVAGGNSRLSNAGGVNDDDSSNNDDAEDEVQPIMEKDLMAYFDDNLNKNWRGREHWKVRSFKKKLLPESEITDTKDTTTTADKNGAADTTVAGTEVPAPAAASKKKKGFELDFFNLDDELDEIVFAPPKKKSMIEMPQRLRINDTHYLLPDDYHFSTEKLTKLFIKSRQTMSLFSNTKKDPKHNASYLHRDTFASFASRNHDNDDGMGGDELPAVADEEFWAETYKRKEQEENEAANGTGNDHSNIIGALPDNPFDDGDDAGIDFNQAFDDAEMNDGDGDSGRPDLKLDGFVKKNEEDQLGLTGKVTYSRVSKKVDVRRLKNNVWKAIRVLVEEQPPSDAETAPVITLSFRDIAHEMAKAYPKELLKDISTSFCFICLLHLSNEHGLTLQNTENFEDLVVVYDTNTIQLS
ncbi:condensin subunit [Maudiozyma humilis]|uniref:Condensin complex subunit 2 n=1 Tax=Maudiozyma humilis TaxID=51915 RepID=A0AAV5RUM6_MAUHU|nr:condensin subunit [Kazachstania humilis]